MVHDLQQKVCEREKLLSVTAARLENAKAELALRSLIEQPCGDLPIQCERPMPGFQFALTTIATSIELAKRDITVNCVAPGLINTEMLADAPVEEALKLIPMHRAGEPDEVASLVSYLLSAPAGYITRQVISVNGGMF